MGVKRELELINLDGGSAQRVNKIISEQVGCGESIDMPITYSSVLAVIGGGLLLPYGVVCKELTRRATTDDNKDIQCVVLSGEATRCPLYGSTEEGGVASDAERIQKLIELQKYVETHVNFRGDINLHSFTE
ncbi:hypothetical protein KBD69_02865 [Candidatus Woesebacteria bacterium]|nr:hypothetical protein [Candidatus Woesebacteria bacterium]